MSGRAQLLANLLNVSRPVGELVRELQAYGWDSDEELAVLTPSHIRSVLERYVDGQLSADSVAAWAEAIEGRDDVGVDDASSEKLNHIIFELANQNINRKLSPLLAQKFIQELVDC